MSQFRRAGIACAILTAIAAVTRSLAPASWQDAMMVVELLTSGATLVCFLQDEPRPQRRLFQGLTLVLGLGTLVPLAVAITAFNQVGIGAGVTSCVGVVVIGGLATYTYRLSRRM